MEGMTADTGIHHDDIGNMPAGPELDALVAEKIMGDPHWEPIPIPEIPGEPCGTTLECCPNSKDAHLAWNLYIRLNVKHRQYAPRSYSTDISAAWAVVERLSSDGEYFSLTHTAGHSEFAAYDVEDKPVWIADFYGHEGEAPAAPLAICRAALKAVSG